MTSGQKFFADETPVPGHQFGYQFDAIGNRNQTWSGGDANGADLRAVTYSPNILNQYTIRIVPGAVDVTGLANKDASVTVNGSPADYRKGEFFWKKVTVPNSANAVWMNASISTSGGGSESGYAFVPKMYETFSHDLDGNLTSDGRWSYTWSAENRLVKMESLAAAPSGSKRRLEFAYDALGRRIWQRVTNLETGVATEYTHLYDGWNLIAECSGAKSPLRSYMWGLDMSRSLQGAGGVGGLLKVTYSSAQTTNCYVAYDGNGNVTALVDAADGHVVGGYEYGPFGELLRATGPMAKANPFRFSTKYQDDETDLLYYGYRSYNPSTGRWINRDPIEERGGKNLYGFVKNACLDRIDVLGRGDFVWVEPADEVDLKNPGGPGITFYRPFSPEAEVYRKWGCCFGVRLSGGTARARVEYNEGEVFGENVLEHERYHVAHHLLPAFKDYKSAAAGLGAPCMTLKRAECIKSAILSELSHEYQDRADRDGAAYDYLAYGWQAGNDAWQRSQETEEKYQRAVSATAAAIAACPAE